MNKCFLITEARLNVNKVLKTLLSDKAQQYCIDDVDTMRCFERYGENIKCYYNYLLTQANKTKADIYESLDIALQNIDMEYVLTKGLSNIIMTIHNSLEYYVKEDLLDAVKRNYRKNNN